MARTPAARRSAGAAKKSVVTPKVGFVSLGCPKVLVDSERIPTQLRAEGYETTPTYDAADVVVINTCGFIAPAVSQSRAPIAAARWEKGEGGGIGGGPWGRKIG